MYERCRGVWPERFKHGYAHYSGAFMEEYFFRHWTAARLALPQVSTRDTVEIRVQGVAAATVCPSSQSRAASRGRVISVHVRLIHLKQFAWLGIRKHSKRQQIATASAGLDCSGCCQDVLFHPVKR